MSGGGLGIISFALWSQGEWDKARENVKKLEKRLVGNTAFNRIDNLAWHNWMVGNFDRAEELYRFQLERMEAGYIETSGNNNFRHRLAYIWMKKGKEEEAKALLEENIAILKAQSQEDLNDYGNACDVAQSYLLLGQKEDAYRWLDKVQPNPFLDMLLQVDPIFHPLREEQEFQNLIEASYQRQDNVRQILNKMQVDQQLKWMVEG